jgi:hypothetical protein
MNRLYNRRNAVVKDRTKTLIQRNNYLAFIKQSQAKKEASNDGNIKGRHAATN